MQGAHSLHGDGHAALCELLLDGAKRREARAVALREIELAERDCLSKGVTRFQDAGSSFETVDLRLDRQRCWQADDPWCWLKPDELTNLRWMALRGDRVVALFTLNRTKHESSDQDTFRLAYVVRAATPGDFVMPPVVVEDAANPGRFARSATARVSVSPR